MNILVLNGSPKGDYSITLHTVLYLQKKYPDHTFNILHVGQKIKAIERDFKESAELIKNADALLFAYPVYTFIATCQLHRFIELMKENNAQVKGKIATQITTSKHFYDVTAHKYIQDNCDDMGINYIRGLSADMDDLTTEKGRKEAESFFEHFIWCAENRYFEKPVYKNDEFTPVPATAIEENNENKSGNVVIVGDVSENDEQLKNMISRFSAKLLYKTRFINIREYPFKGGCLGCFRCAADGVCVYKDGFDNFLRNDIQTADAIVYAFKIKDHSMGSVFKMYDDRQFCNGHRTVTIGMPVGYLISGNYGEETNLQMILEGRAQVGGNILAGIATDEENTDYEIDKLASSLDYALKHKNTQPQNFYGVGGMRIFRDLIYQMRGLMKADHKFFKSHGQYDFPQKNFAMSMLMYLVGGLNASPKVRAKMGNKMNEGMVMPYKMIIDKMDKQ